MDSANLMLFLTIAIIVIAIKVENANAVLAESTLRSPKLWCEKYTTYVDQDGRYALREVYFNWKFIQAYNKYIYETVVGLIESGVIVLQGPSEYCSSNRAPIIAQEKLTQLSTLGLQAHLTTKTNENNTSKHRAMTSQTGASSTLDFDLNLTPEEYNEKIEMNKKMKIT